MSSPSSTAMHVEFKKYQQKHNIILNGRPYGCIGPPIILYNKVFGDFLDDFTNEELAIDKVISGSMENIIKSAANIYELEKDRIAALNESTKDIFGSLIAIEIQNARLDSALTEKLHKLKENAALIIAECKNEIGTGGKDPAIQGGLAYAKYWSADGKFSV